MGLRGDFEIVLFLRDHIGSGQLEFMVTMNSNSNRFLQWKHESKHPQKDFKSFLQNYPLLHCPSICPVCSRQYHISAKMWLKAQLLFHSSHTTLSSSLVVTHTGLQTLKALSHSRSDIAQENWSFRGFVMLIKEVFY